MGGQDDREREKRTPVENMRKFNTRRFKRKEYDMEIGK